MKNRKKAVILQYRLLHYRVKFFELLHERCADTGIDLHLVHGQPTQQEKLKNDTGHIDWADIVENRYITVGGRDILWQPYPDQHKDAGLVVMMQENRLLSNYAWLFGKSSTNTRTAYWGHGKNFQSVKPTGLREAWKSRLINKVDWWFAYTSMTVDILKTEGFPGDRITCLNNAIDTTGFQKDLASVTDEEIFSARAALQIGSHDKVAIFCGSLYPDKRLDLLIASADWIKARLPDFTLIVLGDGPSMPEMREAAQSRPWIKLLGVTKGHGKAIHFRLARVMMNPGLVGLHVVDAFCAGLIMVTTRNAMHSPEVAYLQDLRNGRMCDDTPEAYGGAVTEILQNDTIYQRMSQAALEDSQKYTLDNMVDNFHSGIISALA